MSVSRVLVLSAAMVASAACRRVEAPPLASPAHGAREQPRVVELTAEGVANAGIRTVRAGSIDTRPSLVLAGTLVADPRHLAIVGTRVPGRIVSIMADLGDRVRAGDPLLEVDTVELHQTSLEFLTAVAREREAATALVRQRQLLAEHIGSVADLQRAEANAETSAAAVSEGEEHLHFLGLTERDIRRLRAQTTHGEARSVVRAPIAGRITTLDAAIGRVVSGNETLVSIAEITTLWAVLHVYEHDLARVPPGTHVRVRTAGDPPREIDGTVSFVSDLVEPGSRASEVRVRIENPDESLRPGMSVTARAAIPSDATATWLPPGSVQHHDGATVVFVRTGPQRFEMRDVVAGEEESDLVPVSHGLAAGDDVVVEGALLLRGELEHDELESD